MVGAQDDPHPPQGRLTVRLEVELLDELRHIAERNERTVSQQARSYIRDGLDRDSGAVTVTSAPAEVTFTSSPRAR
jgi:hypothetical protein